MYDPTYTGKSRKTLEPIINEENTTISFFVPPNLGGRPPRSIKYPAFEDKNSVGYSKFEHKGSVLFANIDAVFNLTRHVGGYFTNSTQNDNMHFYSLFFEDRNLELYSYIQWRLPLSITRLVTSKSVGRIDLEGINLDFVEFDVPTILEGRPVDGYQVIGTVSHHTLALKSLTLMSMIIFSSLSMKNGKAFICFPFTRKSDDVVGGLSIVGLVDLIILLGSLFNKVYLFRPYMCYDFICIGLESVKAYPPKDSPEETQLLSIWSMLDISPSSENTSPTRSQHNKEFNRIFYDVQQDSTITKKVTDILFAPEPQSRDRVEVISRWQIPDQLTVSLYPRFKNLPQLEETTARTEKKSPHKKFHRRGKPRIATP